MNTTIRTAYRRFLVPVLLAGLVLAGCASPEETTTGQAQQATRRPARVEALKLQPTSFADEIQLTGTVEAPDDATLSAQTSGTLILLKPLGTYVEAGQTVAQVDAGLARAALKQVEAQVAAAQAQFDLAQDNYTRQEPLYRDSIISALEFQNVRAQRNQAEAGLSQVQGALAQTQEQLANTRIVAPFSGTVEEHLFERGEQVSPGQQVVRVVSTRRVKVKAGVPERYAGDIKVGTPVKIRLQAYGLAPLHGRVTFAGAAINPDNRTFPIEIALDNPEGQLKPEMVAQLAVTRQALDDVLVLPQPAIVRDENGNSAFVVVQQDDGPVALRRPVTLGSASDGRVVVTSGVETGDVVVVLGQTTLTDGDAVAVSEPVAVVAAAGMQR